MLSQDGAELEPLLDGEQELGDGSEEQGLSVLGTTAMTVNTIVGAGIVGLPYAFYHSGGWLALGCLIVATILSGINVGYLVEVTGWCEGFQAEQDAVEARAPSAGSARFAIKNRKFEMSEMCGVLLAPRVETVPFLRYFADEDGKVQLYRRFLEFAFFSFVFGSCWLYSTAFASTLSMLIELPGHDGGLDIHKCWAPCSAPKAGKCGEGCTLEGAACIQQSELTTECWASYRKFLLVYLAFQLMMCCVNLNTFKNIQVVLSGSALLAILVMVSTSVAEIASDGGDGAAYDRVPPLNPEGVVSIISTGLFAQMCHQAVATILHTARHKPCAKAVFSGALTYTLVLYAALGFACSYHLGPRTNQIITLNWIDYNGGVPKGSPVPFWALAARWLVLLFPIFSVSAAFSLQIIPLSETVSCLVPATVLPAFPRASKALAIRVLLTFLPIAAAAGLRDVARILEFNGIFGFVIGFFTPCFLQLAALRRAEASFGPGEAMRTPYWDGCSPSPAVRAVLAVSAALFSITLYQTVQDYLQ